MGGKVLFWLSVVAIVAYLGNVVMLAVGHTFEDAAIALSFLTNAVFYGMLAYGIYHTIKKEEKE
ncbi:hypothetical protein [Lederbergia citri]|uniref:Uncharacterized protein n=1 Tax=Lederbergia citri TaxID=2833580 RepID=A0A942YGB4_9BACI|nr:hypothetical protein [Lederbergia citri]MBS4195362.1 hypothetical protein [Lederbergia citri]